MAALNVHSHGSLYALLTLFTLDSAACAYAGNIYSSIGGRGATGALLSNRTFIYAYS